MKRPHHLPVWHKIGHTSSVVALNQVLHSEIILHRMQPPVMQELRGVLLELRWIKFLTDYYVDLKLISFSNQEHRQWVIELITVLLNSKC